MFKKIFSLTYNEIVKIFKKISAKVIVALILVIAIGMPIGINMIKSGFNTNHYSEMHVSMVKDYENQIEELKNDKTEKGRLSVEWFKVEKEYYKLLADNKISYDDWRDREAQNYRETLNGVLLLKEIIKGTDEKLLIENIHNFNPEKLEEYNALSKEKQKKKLDELTKEVDEAKNIIEKNDYQKYLTKSVAKTEKSIVEDKKQITEVEKEIKKNKEKKDEKANEPLEKQLLELKKSINHSEKMLEIDKYRIDNKIDFNKKDWKNNTLEATTYNTDELILSELLNEKQFEDNKARGDKRFDTYEEYVNNYNNNKIKLEKKISKNWYSLKNNKPQVEFIKDARSVVNSTYSVVIILTSIFLIIIGGGIVSREFSTGTIRLLMIRPVSRTKILLSKVLALLTLALTLIIVGIAALTISSGVVYGFETFKYPILDVINGSVVEIGYMSYLMKEIVLSCASVVFIISLVFTLSTLSNNTAIASSVATVIYLGSMPLTIVLANMKMKWIVATLIPYISQPIFNLMPFMTEMLSNDYGINFNPAFGALQLIVASIIMLVISFIVFNKKDIKN